MIRTLTFCTAVWKRIDATCEGSKVVGTTLTAEGSALKRVHLRDAVTPAMCSKLDFCRAGRTNCCCRMKDAGSPSRSAVQQAASRLLRAAPAWLRLCAAIWSWWLSYMTIGGQRWEMLCRTSGGTLVGRGFIDLLPQTPVNKTGT